MKTLLTIALLSLTGCVGNRASLVEIPAKPDSRLPETIEAAGTVLGGAYDRLFGGAE